MGLSGAQELLLIVDDDPDIRSLSSRFLLATNGWEVIEADCGDSCAEFAGLEQPDAILLDIAMPGQDGMAMLMQMRADPRRERSSCCCSPAGCCRMPRP